MNSNFSLQVTVLDGNRNLIALYGEDEVGPCLRLMLDNGHYYLLKQRTCYRGGRSRPTLKGQTECQRCGRKFKGEHTCNFQRERYFAQQVKGFRLMSVGRSVLGNAQPNKKWKNQSRIGYATRDSSSYMEGIYVFDFETFFKPDNGEAVPYCVGTHLTEREGNPYMEFRGPQCVVDLVDDILESNQHVKPLTLLSFNGSGFDYNFILSELLRRGVNFDMMPSGSRLLHFRIGDHKTGISSFDLYLFMMTSLNKVCKDFKLSVDVSKDIFPHKFVTGWETLA